MGNSRRDITVNASELLGTKKPLSQKKPAQPKAPVKKAAAGDAPVKKQPGGRTAQDAAFDKPDKAAQKKKRQVKANSKTCTLFALLSALLGMVGVAFLMGFPPVSLVFGILGILAARASKRRIGKFDRNPQWIPGMAFSVIAIVLMVMCTPGWVMRMHGGDMPKTGEGSTYVNMIDSMSKDAKDASEGFGSFWDKVIDPLLPPH